MHILIFGAGISGLASALALTRHLSPSPKIMLIELRPCIYTIGGAIGLTPSAVRALHHLGVLSKIREKKLGCTVDKIELFNIYTANKLGEVNFTDPGDQSQGFGKEVNENCRFKGLRIMRKDLIDAMLSVMREKEDINLEF